MTVSSQSFGTKFSKIIICFDFAKCCSSFLMPSTPSSMRTLSTQNIWDSSFRKYFARVALQIFMFMYFHSFVFVFSVRSSQAVRQAALLRELRHSQQSCSQQIARSTQGPNTTPSLQTRHEDGQCLNSTELPIFFEFVNRIKTQTCSFWKFLSIGKV